MLVKNLPLLRVTKTVIDMAALRAVYCLYKAAQAIIAIGHLFGSGTRRLIDLCARCRTPPLLERLVAGAEPPGVLTDGLTGPPGALREVVPRRGEGGAPQGAAGAER